MLYCTHSVRFVEIEEGEAASISCEWEAKDKKQTKNERLIRSAPGDFACTNLGTRPEVEGRHQLGNVPSSSGLSSLTLKASDTLLPPFSSHRRITKSLEI